MAYSDNTVTATIKLRTEAPTENLKNGEIYLKTETVGNISYLNIYVGDGTSNLEALTPFVLRVNGNSLEPRTIGGFTNNGNSLTGGAGSVLEGTFNGSFSGNITSLTSETLSSSMYGNEFPENPAEGQVFFKIPAE